ncbi:IclR family transcriptional regulator [Halopiger aswanensis]|uniref:IclR family transcriptional regulator n=1 Tax=Halopiger aswanensis TaxID=148449 RepID=A0A3R7GG01_9EURY|nr:IclR family transcriptional regulator [Halopiger aswanensis]RKD89175.1 IclR family transcriptional regulator [Halopiger aswanensis]
MGKNGSTGSNRVQAVTNVFEIIEEVGELGSCGVRELATHMDLPKSTVHVYLKTLEEIGYVVKRNGEYRLSFRFLNTGGQVRHNNRHYQAGRNEVDELARTTGEVATMGCEERGYRVMLYRTEPTGAIFNNAPTGEYTRMHWTALGKALLSRKSADEIEDIVDRRGLPQATEHTIVDRDALREEIESIRSRGYAVENEERVAGVKSVAVPIETDDETPDVAISVAGPKHDFDENRIQEELLPALRNTANVIELKTKHY